MSSPRPRRLRALLFVASWLIVLVAIFANQQRIIDWWKLRGYAPDSSVVALSTKNTMTAYAQHLLYVNKPHISNGQDFTAKCPRASEKTVILGCYLSGDNGIFLFSVADSRLAGVVEVTAAHEMLHAAYARLSSSERERVDALLDNYYQNDLTDQRIKDTIAAYRKSEPADIENEMHSIFGTEIANLPVSLEDYYKKYFNNRTVVVAFMQSYQAEFTSRRDQVNAYDAELASLRQTIDDNQASIREQRSDLDSQMSRMEKLRASDEIASFNAMVSVYNEAVKNYNDKIQSTRNAINSYNDKVERRNALALEERQLAQALSADAIPTQK